MRIDQLSLTNFKCYASLEIPLAPGINVFAGVNGSGKTSLLEALCVATGTFFGSQEQKMQHLISLDQIRIFQGKRLPEATVAAASARIGEWSRTMKRDTKTNDIRFTKSLSDYGKHFFEAFEQPENREIAPVISYYSTQRLFKDAYQSKKQQYDPALGRRNGYLQCLEEKAIKRVLTEWLGNAVTRRATQQIKGVSYTDFVLENVEEVIRRTLTFFLDLPPDFPLKIYQDPDIDNELFLQYQEEHPLPLSYYSDGFRNLLFLLMDLTWRASQLNPWLPLAELSAHQSGTVMIDEIDLHLHPRWQGKALGLLQMLFPHVQFFVTTHSPTVIANFELRKEEDAVIDAIHLLEGDRVIRLHRSFLGSDINTVLAVAMGADVRAPQILQLLHAFDGIAENPDATDEEIQSLPTFAEQIRNMLPGTDRELLRVNAVMEKIK